MDSLHSIISKHQKGKHLSFEECVIIQTRIKDGFSLRAIAREIGCSPSTISYEVKRGTVLLYNGHQKLYKAEYRAVNKACNTESKRDTFRRKAETDR